MSSNFALLPGEAAKNRQRDAYVALLPIGACEYHGPHAAMGTDFVIAETSAQRIAAKLEQSGKPSCVLPTIQYGYSVAHLEYPGTLSLCADTLTLILRDLFRSLAQSGTRFLMILNGHDGNVPSINIAASEFRLKARTPFIAACTYLDLTRGDSEIGQPFADDAFRGKGHGGAEETALLAAAHPESVDTTLASEGKVDSQLLSLLGQPRPLLSTESKSS